MIYHEIVEAKPYKLAYDGMIVIVIGLLRTILSGLYRHRRVLEFTWSRLQGRNHNIQIAKLVFHAKESPTRTRDEASILYLHSPTVRPKDIVRLSEDPLIQDSLSYVYTFA